MLWPFHFTPRLNIQRDRRLCSWLRSRHRTLLIFAETLLASADDFFVVLALAAEVIDLFNNRLRCRFSFRSDLLSSTIQDEGIQIRIRQQIELAFKGSDMTIPAA